MNGIYIEKNRESIFKHLYLIRIYMVFVGSSIGWGEFL